MPKLSSVHKLFCCTEKQLIIINAQEKLPSGYADAGGKAGKQFHYCKE